ncbi:hypothetical protein SAMN04487911_1811 [Arenibacter nanhaiticus]|uniref:Uncharacterized protein n=1 Tax=Arenibacter nanhaiticus TaxID=558155 RepID=A0A1M6NMB4_9FLAO|nr:hypothetical protein [Arenibacter nanhaiticus]SHJ96692.1 hypothetical protein SAMN04487911_1791 [Arenibacter nanhaiticus]SHJ96924.1 hypothetical protein SAMN04487911_1811 [Arenibacter nanhaiticus]
MKKSIFIIFLVSYLPFLSAQNDRSSASHNINITIPEIALLDIYNGQTGSNVDVVNLNVSNDNNTEAGQYNLTNVSYGDIWLNYTSVVGDEANGYQPSREITVQLEPESSFPAGLDLRVTAETPRIVQGGGSETSGGNVTPGGVALGSSNAAGVEVTLVKDIKSVYTGDGANGVRLTYTLEQKDNFSLVQAGNYQAVIRFMLTDL